MISEEHKNLLIEHFTKTLSRNELNKLNKKWHSHFGWIGCFGLNGYLFLMKITELFEMYPHEELDENKSRNLTDFHTGTIIGRGKDT